jgi:hypothetical protein
MQLEWGVGSREWGIGSREEDFRDFTFCYVL